MERRKLASRANWCRWSALSGGQGQVTQPKWHPQLVLRESDIEDKAKLSHGAGLFEDGVRVDESGGKQGSLDTPYGSVLDTRLAKCQLYRSCIIALSFIHRL